MCCLFEVNIMAKNMRGYKGDAMVMPLPPTCKEIFNVSNYDT